MKTYGYQRGDLIYYKLTDMSLNDGLVQLKTDKDVLKIKDYHKSETIVVVYTISKCTSSIPLTPTHLKL